MTRKDQLAHMVSLIQNANPYLGKNCPNIKQANEFAKEHGITANMHIGGDFPKGEEDKVAELLMGQFVDGYEQDNVVAYPAILGCSESFLNGEWWPKKKNSIEKMTRKEQLACVVGMVETACFQPLRKENLPLQRAIEFAKTKGITADMHVGVDPQITEDQTAEYLMGQFVDGYEKDSYYGYRAAINLSMGFLHGTWPMKHE